METLRCLCVILCGGLAIVSSQTPIHICLTSDVYEIPLTCANPLKILVQAEIIYGVNTQQCNEACCVDNEILCTLSLPTADNIFTICNGLATCVLRSIIDIPLRTIQCDNNSPKNATFATVTYTCVDEATTLPTTTAATSMSTVSKSMSTHNTTQGTSTSAMTNGEGLDKDKDLGLVMGLSIAGGIIIIAIVAVGVVFCTRTKRHHSYDSSNSSKTLASSDMESGNSPGSGQNFEDKFGFAKSAEGQQERLQKRNDNIKRTQSFKSEESKNKRPTKLSKHKSKSKSSSLDQLDKSAKDSKVTKKDSETKKQAVKEVKKADSKETKQANNQNDAAIAHPVDSKSQTNLLSI